MSHFLGVFSKAYEKPVTALAPGTLNALLNHSWPGNVRELENAIERAVVLSTGPMLTTDDLPLFLTGSSPQHASLEPASTTMSMVDIERDAILRTMEAASGSTARAAELLGISVRKIQYRLKEYGSA